MNQEVAKALSLSLSKDSTEECTPLHRALEQNDEELLNQLLSNPNIHTIINQPNQAGLTPLLLAVNKRLTKKVESLLELGANPHIKDPQGQTALNNAIQLGESAIVELLLSQTSIQNSPWIVSEALHVALKERQMNSIELLLEKYKAPNMPDPDGHTIYDLAEFSGSAAITAMIQKHFGNLSDITAENPELAQYLHRCQLIKECGHIFGLKEKIKVKTPNSKNYTHISTEGQYPIKSLKLILNEINNHLEYLEKNETDSSTIDIDTKQFFQYIKQKYSNILMQSYKRPIQFHKNSIDAFVNMTSNIEAILFQLKFESLENILISKKVEQISALNAAGINNSIGAKKSALKFARTQYKDFFNRMRNNKLNYLIQQYQNPETKLEDKKIIKELLSAILVQQLKAILNSESTVQSSKNLHSDRAEIEEKHKDKDNDKDKSKLQEFIRVKQILKALNSEDCFDVIENLNDNKIDLLSILIQLHEPNDIQKVLQAGFNTKISLWNAASSNNIPILHYLIQNAKLLKINEPNEEGMTALMLAVRHNHCDMVLLLLQNGASMDCVNKNNETALTIAQQQNNQKMQQILLNPSARTIQSQNKNQYTLNTGEPSQSLTTSEQQKSVKMKS